MQDGSQASAGEIEKVKELLSWNPEGKVYIDYLDLAPVYEKAVQVLKEKDTNQTKVALQVLEMLKRRAPSLDGSSSLAVRPDGLHYRSLGISNLSLVAMSSAILVPNFARARGQGQLTACKSNLKNIGTGLEMYSTDWSGRYPEDIDAITPDYLVRIPECPSAGTDTYSATCLLYTSPSPRDRQKSRMPSSA